MKLKLWSLNMTKMAIRFPANGKKTSNVHEILERLQRNVRARAMLDDILSLHPAFMAFRYTKRLFSMICRHALVRLRCQLESISVFMPSLHTIPATPIGDTRSTIRQEHRQKRSEQDAVDPHFSRYIAVVLGVYVDQTYLAVGSPRSSVSTSHSTHLPSSQYASVAFAPNEYALPRTYRTLTADTPAKVYETLILSLFLAQTDEPMRTSLAPICA